MSSERKEERESRIIELCMREKSFMVENLFFSLGEESSQACILKIADSE